VVADPAWSNDQSKIDETVHIDTTDTLIAHQATGDYSFYFI
jgi:hypothetical protein